MRNGHTGRSIVSALAIVSFLLSAVPSAQSVTPSQSNPSQTTLWTAVGAGAGFGAGLWIGLTAFDDAVNSDRKVWTTAVLSAAGGGILGYLISRNRSAPQRARPINPRRPATLTTLPIVGAPPLGTGAFRTWLTSLRSSATPSPGDACLKAPFTIVR
jgi:hypothetical protein